MIEQKQLDLQLQNLLSYKTWLKSCSNRLEKLKYPKWLNFIFPQRQEELRQIEWNLEEVRKTISWWSQYLEFGQTDEVPAEREEGKRILAEVELLYCQILEKI